MPEGYLKGKVRRRKVPLIHDERKRNFNITLTETAIGFISAAAKELKLSRSEFIERWARDSLAK